MAISNKSRILKGAATAVVFILVWFVCWKESKNPYKDSWIYRTFIQNGFNTEIAIRVEFDGIPYDIHRIVWCRREVGGEWAKPSYGFVPEYYAFGIKTKTGEGIIVTTPSACHQRGVSIPTGHLPLMAVADNADDPTEIIVYASRQAYRNPTSRLQFKEMSISPPKGLNQYRFFADSRDQFAFFSLPDSQDQRYNYADKPKRISWNSCSFLPIPHEVWSSPDQGLSLPDEMRDKFLDTQEPRLLNINEETKLQRPGYGPSEKRFDPRLPFFGLGLFPGPLLDGWEFKMIGSTKYYDWELPYRLKGNVWEPELESQGMILLTHPRKIKNSCFLLNEESTVGIEKDQAAIRGQFLFGEDVINYPAEPAARKIHPEGRISITRGIYIPKSKTVYIPWGLVHETYAPNITQGKQY